ncbi:MAG TPA: amino acid permease, partial [Bacteroidales bacterium]|nr:amino acid permease [Bacteroidales bacterium]
NDTCRLLIAIAILLVGLFINYLGIKIAGQIQIAVVLTTLTVLIVTITGSFSKIEPDNFIPFIPNSFGSIGYTATLLFWCFIGWEAVSNLSEEFQNPGRDAITGTIIAAVIISIIYFLTAFVIVGTHSFGNNISDASLVHMIKRTFGASGAVIAGFAALFICMAPAIAYIGAVSRMAYSLAENGYAPKALVLLSRKYKTPLGGLFFLTVCFSVLLFIFSTRIISMATLIQIPSATFILTYLGACAAGIKLLKGSKLGEFISFTSLILSAVIFLFVKWTVLYPIMITFVWLIYMLLSRKITGIKELFKCGRWAE